MAIAAVGDGEAAGAIVGVGGTASVGDSDSGVPD